jgi:hypothetical protein
MFEHIVPLDRDAVEMERSHPSPLIGRGAHAVKVYGTLVKPGQRIAFTIEGWKSDLRATCALVVAVVLAKTATALSATATAMCSEATTSA